MTHHLRVYFHFRSPYSRLGVHRLHRASLPEDVDLSLHILSRSAGEEGVADPTRTKARRRYLMQDVPRETMRMGLPLGMPALDVDWHPAMTAFYQAREMGKGLDAAAALSNARWGEGKDISDLDVCRSAMESIGVTLDQAKPVDTEALRQADQEMVESDGAFGVPFGVLDKGAKHPELFFGQDRFDVMLESAGAKLPA